MTTQRRIRAKQAGHQSGKWTILGILIVIALAVSMIQFGSAKPSSAQAQNATPRSTKPISAIASSTLSTREALPTRLEVTWPVQIERNVFTWRHEAPAPQVVVQTTIDPQAIAREARQAIHLQGIMLDGTPRILANGVIIRQGQTLRGFVVQQINQREIILEKQGVRIRMGL